MIVAVCPPAPRRSGGTRINVLGEGGLLFEGNYLYWLEYRNQMVRAQRVRIMTLATPQCEINMTQLTDAERKKSLVMRLKRIEGQLRGIQRLIEEDADCEKVAQQLAAARKALDKSFYSLVSCVIAQGDVPPDDVAELLTRFS